MGWEFVLTQRQVNRFSEMLISSHESYAGITPDIVKDDLMLRPEAELSIYTGSGFNIVMCFYESRTLIEEERAVRILICMPIGGYTREDLPEIAKISIRRYRNYMDTHNKKHAISKSLDDYGYKDLNNFFQFILPEYMHEYKKGKTDSQTARRSGSWGMSFKREADKKATDESFSGTKRTKPTEGDGI